MNLSINITYNFSALLALLALCACAHEPPAPIAREQLIELTATIESIDRDSRMLSLRAADGRRATVYAGPEVRNFDRIELGDAVVASFYEAIGVEVTTPERAARGVRGESAVMRAALGERPAGAIAETLVTTVEIDAVDTSLNTVTFRRADGLTRILAVEDPQAQAFIRELKRGDRVQVTYMEAVAVSVRHVERSRS